MIATCRHATASVHPRNARVRHHLFHGFCLGTDALSNSGPLFLDLACSKWRIQQRAPARTTPGRGIKLYVAYDHCSVARIESALLHLRRWCPIVSACNWLATTTIAAKVAGYRACIASLLVMAKPLASG
jgi:hypothetical protein